MAVLYAAAGVNHFISPRTYLKIMPPYLPYHRELVVISGVLEIVLGILLIPAATRVYAAWGIIALLIAVFPANIQMAVDWQQKGHAQLWIAYARLPLQLLLIWWAYVYTRK